MIPNNNKHILGPSETARIMQTVDYDLWLIDREVRKKNVKEITYDFSYVAMENNSSVTHLDGLLEPKYYMIREVTGFFNNKRMKKCFLLHKDYDINSLIQAKQVTGGEFLDDDGRSLFFLHTIE